MNFTQEQQQQRRRRVVKDQQLSADEVATRRSSWVKNGCGGITEGTTTAAESIFDDTTTDEHRPTEVESAAFPAADGLPSQTFFPGEIAAIVHEEFPSVYEPLPPCPSIPRPLTEDVFDLRDVPSSIREFSDLSDPHFIVSKCRELIPGWYTVPAEGVVVAKILAGLTNLLFAVSLKEPYASELPAAFASMTSNLNGSASVGSGNGAAPSRRKLTGSLIAQQYPTKVLFRIYGKDVGELYDPAFEVQVYKTLARRGIAPALVGEFPGGRIEEWIDGSSLDVQDAGKERVLVSMAKILGGLHKLHRETELPKSWSTEPACRTHLARWVDTVKNFIATSPEAHPTLHALSTIGVEEMLDEVSDLNDKLIPQNSPPSPATSIVFSHNDVQENNIMRVAGGDRLRLIDFEYSAFNYAGYDVANLFIECTIDYTYPEYPFYKIDESAYPSRASRRLFAAVYLSEVLDRPVSPNELDIINVFLDGVERMALASHLMWGFWSIIRSPQAPTFEDFAYLSYARDRFTLYRKQLAYLGAKGAFSVDDDGLWPLLHGASFASDEDAHEPHVLLS